MCVYTTNNDQKLPRNEFVRHSKHLNREFSTSFILDSVFFPNLFDYFSC